MSRLNEFRDWKKMHTKRETSFIQIRKWMTHSTSCSGMASRLENIWTDSRL